MRRCALQLMRYHAKWSGGRLFRLGEVVLKPAWQMSRVEYLSFVVPILIVCTLGIGLAVWRILDVLSQQSGLTFLEAAPIRLGVPVVVALAVFARKAPGILGGHSEARRAAQERGLLPQDDNLPR